VDPNAPDVIAEPINPKLAAAAKELADDEAEEAEEAGEDEEVVDTGPGSGGSGAAFRPRSPRV